MEAVITGHCGPKAFRTLSVAGIKLFTGAEGTVADTLKRFRMKRFREGMLAEAEEADVEGHWF